MLTFKRYCRRLKQQEIPRNAPKSNNTIAAINIFDKCNNFSEPGNGHIMCRSNCPDPTPSTPSVYFYLDPPESINLITLLTGAPTFFIKHIIPLALGLPGQNNLTFDFRSLFIFVPLIHAPLAQRFRSH